MDDKVKTVGSGMTLKDRVEDRRQLSELWSIPLLRDCLRGIQVIGRKQLLS